MQMPTACDGNTVRRQPYSISCYGCAEAAAKMDKEHDAPELYKSGLEKVGFVNMHQKIYQWPFNQWPKDPKLKELGIWTQANVGYGAKGIALAFFT
jgi:hypothetical protein